jgi:hypothetical protein
MPSDHSLRRLLRTVDWCGDGVRSSFLTFETRSGSNCQNGTRQRSCLLDGADVCEPAAQQAADAFQSARPGQGEYAVAFVLHGSHHRKFGLQLLAWGAKRRTTRRPKARSGARQPFCAPRGACCGQNAASYKVTATDAPDPAMCKLTNFIVKSHGAAAQNRVSGQPQ